MIENRDIHSPLSIEALQADTQTRELLDRLDQKQLYHNYRLEPSRHTLRVVDAATLLAQSEALSYSSTEELRASALLHDIGFSFGSAGHEERGAEISGDILRRLGVHHLRIENIQGNILATHGVLTNGAYVTSPETIEQKILCDADMNLAGQNPEVFLQMGDLLRQEIGIKDADAWNHNQLSFLKEIRWHTPSASQLWEEQRQINIQAVADLLPR